MTLSINNKLLAIETVGSQDRPINEADRKAFRNYFKQRIASKDQQGRASTIQAKRKQNTT